MAKEGVEAAICTARMAAFPLPTSSPITHQCGQTTPWKPLGTSVKSPKQIRILYFPSVLNGMFPPLPLPHQLSLLLCLSCPGGRNSFKVTAGHSSQAAWGLSSVTVAAVLMQGGQIPTLFPAPCDQAQGVGTWHYHPLPFQLLLFPAKTIAHIAQIEWTAMTLNGPPQRQCQK